MKKQIAIISLCSSVIMMNNCMEDENQKQKTSIERMVSGLEKIDNYCDIRAKNLKLAAIAKNKLSEPTWQDIYYPQLQNDNPAIQAEIDQLIQLRSDIHALLQPNERLCNELKKADYFNLSPLIKNKEDEKATFKRVPTLLLSNIMLQSPQLEKRLTSRIDRLCSHLINDKIITKLQDAGNLVQNKDEITKKYQSLTHKKPHTNYYETTDPHEKEIASLIDCLVHLMREKENSEIMKLVCMRVEEIIRIRKKEKENEEEIAAIAELQDTYDVDTYKQELNKKIKRMYTLEAIQQHLANKLSNDSAAFMITQCACITNHKNLEIMITELHEIIKEKTQ